MLSFPFFSKLFYPLGKQVLVKKDTVEPKKILITIIQQEQQLAGEEVVAIGRVVDVTINKQDDDKRNPFAILSEERQAEK